MKLTSCSVAFLAAAVLTVGCDKRQPTPTPPIEDKTVAAPQDIKDYSFAQKAEFTARMEIELAAINKEIDQLAARIEQSSDAVKAEAKPKLEALRAQSASLRTQLDEVKDATGPTWDGVKAGTKRAYTELREGFTQVRQWVSEKVAP